MKMSKHIRNLREEMKMTEQEFADICGFSVARLQHLESDFTRSSLSAKERETLQQLHIEYTPNTRRRELIHKNFVRLGAEEHQAKLTRLESSNPPEKRFAPKTQELRHKIRFLLDCGFTAPKLAHEITDIMYEDRGQVGALPRAPISKWIRGEAYPSENVIAHIDRMCKGFGYRPKKPVDKAGET
jgi:transcriptional regulator with XRE-family HTH domain